VVFRVDLYLAVHDPPKRLLRRAYAFSTPLPAEDLVVCAGTHV
jgi:hypothetical protein